jgi:ABC-type amino acid transport system permease subunit
MRAFDVIGIGAALVLVPLLAWLLGRFAGRRDWSIGALLTAVVVLAIVIQIDILALFAYFETGATAAAMDYPSRVVRRIGEALQSPEFSAFLLAFAAFIGMLGWSSTPARKVETA